jgi:TIR domain
MPSAYDIFISYGQLDDQDPAGEVKGWVDLLVERLPRLVSNNLGYQPKIWRDERSLSGNALLTAAIEEGLAHSLLFVPILSPRYVQSEWCRRELETFCATPPLTGAAAHRSRIFKVIKSPLLFNLATKEPSQLRELIGYPFYEMEGEMPVEFGHEVQPSKDPRYWSALRRLAWDISNMLAALKDNVNKRVTGPLILPPSNGNSDSSKSVYLAESTSDLAQQRELVRDELRQRGYEVVPDKKLPLEEGKQTEAAIRSALERAVLSVHLIGARYGSTPEDDPRSVVRIQEELAAQHSADNSSFSRLLWIPQGLMTPALEVTDQRQKDFVVELQNRVVAGTELLQTSVEDLKTHVLEKLNPPAKSQAPSARRAKFKQVYLICEDRDRSLVKPIRDYLFDQKIEVITWLDGEEGRTLMDYHRKNLRECDAALVYFGNGDEPWVRKNLEDLEKAYGYGRENDWTASAVYVGAPANDRKDDFRTLLVPLVIRNYTTFDPNDLRDFVNAVQAMEGGQR